MIRCIGWLTLFFILVSQLSYSQSNPFEMSGELRGEGLRPIPYTVKLWSDDQGFLYGNSWTKTETQGMIVSKLYGRLNADDSTISFREIGNEIQNEPHDSVRFCFIHVENQKIVYKNENLILNGKFKGLFSTKDLCARGELILVGKRNQFDAFLGVEDSTSQQVIELPKVNVQPSDEGPLQSGDVLKLEVSTNTLYLSIWDAFDEDYDLVRITLNEVLVEDSVAIFNKRKKMSLELTEGVNLLRIEALNEGVTPPNTMNAIIAEGTVHEHEIVTKLRKGQFVELLLYLVDD